MCCTHISVKSLVHYFCRTLRKILRQILVKHINCHVQRENSVTFLYFRITQGSVATYCRWGGNLCVCVCVRREFSYESPTERILKIGPHLPKLLSNIKGYTFWDTVPHQIIWTWYTCHWWISCYIWYREEGTGRGHSPPRPLLAVPNVTAHQSATSVPITVLLYNGPWLCSFNVPIKGLNLEMACFDVFWGTALKFYAHYTFACNGA